MKKNRILILTLLFLTFFTSIQQVSAFDPRPQGGKFSDVEWGVYVQLLYGSIDGNSVFIPQQASKLPRPELWIVMGGMERRGHRNVSLTSYLYNETSKEYDTFFEYNNYSLALGDGGDPHYAMQEVIFPTTDDKMRIVFEFKDINIEFFYEPIPIYQDLETTKADFQTSIYIWIIITILAGVLSEYPARRLQRHAVAIPGLPILSILAITASIASMVFILTYLSFPFGFLEKIVLFVLGIQPWLLEIPFFILFTLWLGHRHSPDNLKVVQLYYSKFIPTTKKTIWKADMRDDYRAYEKNGKWYICNPTSWSEFFWRLFDFRILMVGHHNSMKPDEGVWKRKDQRIWVAMTDLKVTGGLKPKINKDMRGIGQTVGIMVIGLICFLIIGLNTIEGPLQIVLGIIGFIIVLVGIFGRGSLLELKYSSKIWNFDAIEFIEAEQIMTQVKNFYRLREKINKLQSEIATLSSNFHTHVILFVVQFVEKLNIMLTHRDIIFKYKEAPDPTESTEEFKKRKEKEEKEKERKK